MSRRIAAFIRHADYHQLADTPSALQPFGLTEKGFIQSHQAAAVIAEFIVQNNLQLMPIIHCSSLLRAWQTADVFAKGLADLASAPIEIGSTHLLAERSVGAVANLTTQQIESIIELDPRFDALPDNWKSNSHFKLPFTGAESLMDAGYRVADYLAKTMQQMVDSEHDSITLFIGHGASFRHAACELGILEFEQIAALSMFHAQPLYFEVSDDGSWHHIAGEWKVRTQNTAFTD